MAILIPNDFSSYELTPEEEIRGSIFDITQSQWIQNQLSACATEKLAIEFDTNKPEEFGQQEAYKKGQMDAYRYLLDTSLASQDYLKELTAPLHPED